MKKNYIADLFVHNRWYLLLIIGIFLFLSAFFITILWYAALVYLLVLTALTVMDYVLLFAGKRGLQAQRIVNERLNLGEENPVSIGLVSSFPFAVAIRLIDEVPVQFQKRDFNLKLRAAAGKKQTAGYSLRPVARGEYIFGRILGYVSSPLGLLERRCIIPATQAIKVYPSTRYLRQYQLLALSDSNQYIGVKKTRKLGHSMEFEQIKEYVQGDDIRTINWKATARRGNLMVNNFIDARSQQIYCIIDKGRTMKMPFDGMSLLDYSINAALIFMNIALLKQDRAGLITFGAKVNDIIASERGHMQISKLNEALYRQQTDFKDSSLEALGTAIYHKLSQRSFLLLFTNFETMSSLERQLPYLRKLASRHLLCVVFFENTLLKEIHDAHPDSLEGIYIKTIADRFSFEKKQIVKELRRHGILSVLTTPQELTVDVINKYLELKARQMV
ncbi:DUF58 domain-containing protein [Taibaiella koreensis]|uniref:DUF58 domain-containing protein n=1 Tax=Taibaiella koreensis TaxID=1268548 RepID=UPI000E59AE2D|nr:DUF58 domain-containing protein [Taibaiella koreensis]